MINQDVGAYIEHTFFYLGTRFQLPLDANNPGNSVQSLLFAFYTFKANNTFCLYLSLCK